jgi:hypothetical protein
MYTKSRNDEYSLAIEQCSFLSSFICANYQDEKVLPELAIKHGNIIWIFKKIY